jgi:hypothetical protein
MEPISMTTKKGGLLFLFLFHSMHFINIYYAKLSHVIIIVLYHSGNESG